MTLRRVGIEPTIIVSDVDEDAHIAAIESHGPALTAAEVALELAKAKAHAVALDCSDALVLGCDSVLEIDGAVHGKPVDRVEAIARWHIMRGRSGVLHTGHWLVDTRDGGQAHPPTGALASTTVHFAHLDDHEIEAYVDTGEPLRVAGAFTIDGLGGAFVTRLEGDPHTVVGLSLPLLRELVRAVGVDWFDLLATSGR